MEGQESQSIVFEAVREQFPVLHQEVNGKPLVYFDNAATNQKPKRVIDALTHYYEFDNANIHRGIHTLAERATAAFEDTRKALKTFINAPEAEEIIFTRGTTESINLVASTYGRKFIKAGDEILITGMEHHSNIVPWQMLCEETGAKLVVVPVTPAGEIDMEAFATLLTERTKLVSVVYVSNTLGTINPVKSIIEAAHQKGAVVVVDGAQASSHLEVDVQDLNADFYAFSSHKVYGPTGIGVLYGKRRLLEKMPPYMGGGEMIDEVSFEKTTYNEIPYKFEAGTPNIADAIAFGKALEFVNELGKPAMAAHEDELLRYATNRLEQVKGLKMVGTAAQKIAVASFTLEGVHHFDAGMMLDARGVAVRTGHHCTQPLMKHYGIEGTIRASFAVYNTKSEIDQLIEGLDRIVQLNR